MWCWPGTVAGLLMQAVTANKWQVREAYTTPESTVG
jgi:hypothetical protein